MLVTTIPVLSGKTLMPGALPQDMLRWRDYLLLVAFCLVLFGIALVGGRPLSRHEAVLPQSAREMLKDHDWVVPKSGGRPWLESPPLPQWITVALASLTGHCDREWSVRIGPVAMGTLVVLLIGWMASGWYGRSIGLLSGLATATITELARYAWSAEDEIFLCALVTAAIALFVKLEFFAGLRAEHEPFRFFGLRPWPVFWFFVALGATNLAKGVFFGTVITLVPIAGYVILNRDWGRIRAYLWCWGWLAFLAVALAWPIAVSRRYPDAYHVWFYDQVGRVSGDYTAINQPWWYYAARLPEILGPWIAIAPFGLWLTARDACAKRYSPARLLWCWALLVPAVLSIPGGKHHHYLLHAVAPWGVLVALGLVWLRNKILDWPAWTRNPLGAVPVLGLPAVVCTAVFAHKLGWPHWVPIVLAPAWLAGAVAFSYGLWQSTARVAATTLFAAMALCYLTSHVLAGKYFDRYRDDTAFLKQVRKVVPRDTLYVNAGMGQLEAFHTLFYLDDRTIALHNLSFLIDRSIQGPRVFVITYSRDEAILRLFGVPKPLLASAGTWRDGVHDEKLTLFQLDFHPHLVRHRIDVRISPMQAMQYAPGPFLTELPDPKLRR
jgi:4-amino-4-deoxy-L-arabinose transferase-like glycosyltransferase